MTSQRTQEDPTDGKAATNALVSVHAPTTDGAQVIPSAPRIALVSWCLALALSMSLRTRTVVAVVNQMRIAKAAALVLKPTLACHGDGVRAMMAALLRNCWCSLMANLLLQNGSLSKARMDISASIWVSRPWSLRRLEKSYCGVCRLESTSPLMAVLI